MLFDLLKKLRPAHKTASHTQLNRATAVCGTTADSGSISMFNMVSAVRSKDPLPEIDFGYVQRDSQLAQVLFLITSGRQGEAEKILDLKLEADPGVVHLWHLRALCATEAGDIAAGDSYMREALRIAPNDPRALVSCAMQAFLAGDFYGCQAALDGLTQSPHRNNVVARLLRGQLLDARGKMDQAIAEFEGAIGLAPKAHIAPEMGIAASHLKAGRLSEGLRAWLRADLMAGAFHTYPAMPVWSGQALGQGSILIAQRGHNLGDAIQFLRFATSLKRKHPRAWVAVQVPAELARIASSVEGVDEVLPNEQYQPAHDWFTTTTHLPLVLEETLDSASALHPYVTPPADIVSRFARLVPAGSELKVGLCWAGWPLSVDVKRSVLFAQLQPLFAVPGVRFFNFQMGAPRAALLGTALGSRVVDLTGHVKDLLDSAALLANLDLLISVDTALVHLAGAVGIPVFLLNRPDGDWRWMAEGERSPWYPSVRIFRHPQHTDWRQVIDAAASALAGFKPEAGA